MNRTKHQHTARPRPSVTRARAFLVLATASALCAVTGATSATSASAQPVPGTAAATGQAATGVDQVDYTSACAAPGVGYAACLALTRTGMSHHLQPAAQPSAAPVGFGYGPVSLQSAYQLPSGSAGGSQTVAIVDAFNDPNIAADLATYRAAWGLPACGSGCFSVVNEDGQPSPLPGSAAGTGWDVEESLDVDMVSATCPLCHIVLVEASSPSIADLGTAENTAVSLGARFVSNSYGAADSSSDSANDAAYYDHPGVAVVASAGDAGYGVEYPAASPFVTAVGGTTLTTASSARGWTEAVWGSSSGGPGTGSGCSANEPKPAWQTDAGCAGRTVTDVSADANPNTGVAIYDSLTQGGWLEEGGTSVASPIIAATYALAGTPAAGTTPASYLYQHPANLFDVTSGANGTCSPAYLCTAGPGYDGPTGLGTPDGTAAFTATPATDLGFVKTANTGAGTVEVHIDAPAPGGYRRAFDATSDFGSADGANGTFSLFGSVNGEPELGFVKTRNTGAGTVEVHIDTFSNGAYHRVFDATSDFGSADGANGTFSLFGSVNGEPELGFVKTANTGAGTVEVHIDSLVSGVYRRLSDATSDFGTGDRPNGTFSLLTLG